MGKLYMTIGNSKAEMEDELKRVRKDWKLNEDDLELNDDGWGLEEEDEWEHDILLQ